MRNKNYHTLATLNGITHWKNYSWRAHLRVGEAERDPEGDGRRTLANGWESGLWRLEDKHLWERSSVRQFGKPRPLRIRHRRREDEKYKLTKVDKRICMHTDLLKNISFGCKINLWFYVSEVLFVGILKPHLFKKYSFIGTQTVVFNYSSNFILIQLM